MPTTTEPEQRLAITILIVNRNAESYLSACLRSILDTIGDVSAELMLVDGNSTDGSVALTRTLWPSAKVIEVDERLGYVKANNVGLREARGRYTMFLNSDTEIHPGSFQALVEYLDCHPEAGAVSGTIINPDGSDQGVVRCFPSVMNGIFGRRSLLSRLFPNNPWYRQYMQSRREQGSEPFQTEIVSACSMVVRTELAKELGGLDERFRFYWVDAELCVRIARRGFQIVCVPRAKIMHHEGKGGSTSTFAKRLAMNSAFNHGAYLAYVEYHQLGRLNPLRLLVRSVLLVRTALLLAALLLQPRKATSSGGIN